MNQPYVYIYTLPMGSLPQPPSTPLGHHRALSWAPRALQEPPTSCLLIHSSIHMSVPLSQFIPTAPSLTVQQVHTLHLHLFLPCIQVHQYHFSRFHIYICINIVYIFSLFALLHSVWQTLGSSTSLQLTQFYFFYSWVIGIRSLLHGK